MEHFCKIQILQAIFYVRVLLHHFFTRYVVSSITYSLKLKFSAFTLRPGPPHHTETSKNTTNSSLVTQNVSTTTPTLTLVTKKSEENDDYDVEEWWDNLQEECRLMNLEKLDGQVRFTAELCITLGAFLYLAAAVREARFLGLRMFFENLVLVFIIMTVFCDWSRKSSQFFDQSQTTMGVVLIERKSIDDSTVTRHVFVLLHFGFWCYTLVAFELLGRG